MTLYRKLTEDEEAEARSAGRMIRAVNGLSVLLDEAEVAARLEEETAARFAADKRGALADVDAELVRRITAGYRHGDVAFPADGVTLNDAADIAAGIQATGSTDPVSWPAKDGTVIAFPAGDFVTFTASARMWSSSHSVVARAKKSAIEACASAEALDTHLAANPIEQGWPGA